jgi:putative hemolysin
MSPDQDVALVVVLVVAFVAAMFLAAAETSLLRVSPVRAATLAASAGRRGRRLRRLLDSLSEVLSAILLAALLAQIAAATVTGILAERWFGSFGVTLASVALTVILFVYGEAIPKTYAVRHADRVALALAVPISILETLLRPVVKSLVWVADLQMPGKGITTAPTITEDELKMLAADAAMEGQITATDLDFIQRAFRFGDRRVDDVMVPRLDIVAISSHESVESAMALAVASGHRRLPVYEDTIENLTGVVSLRNLAGVPANRRHEVGAGSIADEPLVAPESKRIFALLTEMQETGIHLAVVVDEFGGTAGIVTLEDIAEELLGSLRADRSSPQIIEISPGQWNVDAATPVEDLAAATGEVLPDGDWNTVAGLIMGLAGHVPVFGDQVDTEGLRLRVVGQRGRRITLVEVMRRSDRGR